MNDIPRDPLIRDLSIVLAGALHPSAVIGPGPRLAARRVRDVLGLEDGASRKGDRGEAPRGARRRRGGKERDDVNDDTRQGERPDFSDWSPARLAAHLEHLDRLLLASLADPGDPVRAQLRADRAAVLEAQRGVQA